MGDGDGGASFLGADVFGLDDAVLGGEPDDGELLEQVGLALDGP